MSGTKRLGLTIIIGIIAALVITMLINWTAGKNAETHTPGEMLEHSTAEDASEAQPDEQKELILQEDSILTMIQDTSADVLQIENLSIDIKENAVVFASGTVNKADVVQLLENQTDSISAAYTAILDLLPDSLPLELSIVIQAHDGAIKIIPKSFLIESMNIPDEWMNEVLFDVVEDSINRELAKQFDTIQTVSSENGCLIISGT